MVDKIYCASVCVEKSNRIKIGQITILVNQNRIKKQQQLFINGSIGLFMLIESVIIVVARRDLPVKIVIIMLCHHIEFKSTFASFRKFSFLSNTSVKRVQIFRCKNSIGNVFGSFYLNY